MKRIVTIDDATGEVLAQWRGGDEQELAPVAGRTRIPLAAEDSTDYSGTRWDGTNFVRTAALPVRQITADAFLQLFKTSERKAIRKLARGDMTAVPAVAPDEDVSDYVDQLNIKAAVDGRVDLDQPRVAAGLDLLIAKGLITAARKTRILAGLPPP